MTHFRIIFTFCGGQYDRRIQGADAGNLWRKCDKISVYRAEKGRGGNLFSAALARPDGADLCDGGDAAVCDGRRGVFGFGRRACSGGTGADAWRLCSVGKGLLSYGHVRCGAVL